MAAMYTPEELLALAQQQMVLLLSGKATVAIDTPQLGRVEFNQTNIADLQRLIDGLMGQVYGTSYGRRRPISVEAWP